LATSREMRRWGGSGGSGGSGGRVPRRGSRLRAITVFALVGLVATGCTRIDNALASVPVFAFMRNAPSFDPYEHPLPPPPGAIPFRSPNGLVLPPLEGSEAALTAFAAGPWGQNPFAADDAAVLALGQVMYERHCAVCHGVQARGDGPMVGQGKFPLMPSLVAAPATDRSDGYVYGVIRAGRGLMPAYGARMTHEERWAVVVYVNALQGAAGAVPPQPEVQRPGAEGTAPAGPIAPARPQPAAPDTPAATPAAAPAGDTVPSGL
jgi:mono/diheme cytochrome c family protein